MSAEIVADLVKQLSLEPHPEGGFYKRWYEAADSVSLERGERPAASSIYYLLEGGGVSRLHTLKSDELWFWHGGVPLTIVELTIGDAGVPFVKETLVGPGHQFNYRVPAGTLFGAYLPAGDHYSFVSCVVTPAFDFRDWAMPSRKQILDMWPAASPPEPAVAELVARLSSAE